MLNAEERNDIVKLFKEFAQNNKIEETLDNFIWYLCFWDVINQTEARKFIKEVQENET